ncbi:hypothetical protein [Mycolicibacterium hodleri]|nr:hypothetical protein [Mycolicibacterium hodleri]
MEHSITADITADRLVDELEPVVAAADGPPLCCGWATVLSWVLRYCSGSA